MPRPASGTKSAMRNPMRVRISCSFYIIGCRDQGVSRHRGRQCLYRRHPALSSIYITADIEIHCLEALAAAGRSGLHLIVEPTVLATHLRLPNLQQKLAISQHIHLLSLGHDDVGGGLGISVAAVHQGTDQTICNLRLDLRLPNIACCCETVAP